MTIVEMQMNIDCDGCEDNVRKALLKLPGVHYVEVDRMLDKVTVTGSVRQTKVLRAARRTGKLAVLWPSAYNHPEYKAYYAQPAASYYRTKPHAAVNAQRYHGHHHDGGGGDGGGGGALVAHRPAAAAAQPPQRKVSSYNYHVHGYYDSDLHGYYHHEQALSGVLPDAARSYFSDDNPHACSIM